MALETVADLVATVRVLLQDRVEPYRYETDQLVVALNIALQDARRIRPDIFMPSFDIPSYSAEDTSAVIKFPDFYKSALIYFMAGFAHMRDEEETMDARVASYLLAFRSELIGTMYPSKDTATPV